MKYRKIHISGNIIAISNDDCLLAVYICQRKLSSYSVDKLDKKSITEHEEFIIKEFRGFVMTTRDISVFNLLKSESDMLYNDGMKLIKELIRCDNLDKKERNLLKDAVDIIEKYSKKNILVNKKTDVELIFTIINMTEDDKSLILRKY